MGSPIARRFGSLSSKGAQSIILPMRREFYTNLSKIEEGKPIQTLIGGKEATVIKRKGRLWRFISRS